jgi:hypothetical protein
MFDQAADPLHPNDVLSVHIEDCVVGLRVGQSGSLIGEDLLMLSEADRDLFDHLFRRSDSNERVRLSALASSYEADTGWLTAINEISRERTQEVQS